MDLAVADLQMVHAAGDLLVHRRIGVERVARLVDVAHLHRVADGDRAAVRLLLARQHPEQRRLAGTVRADDADDARWRQGEREVLDQQAVAEALVQRLHLDDGVAEALARGNDDLQLAGVVTIRFGLGLQLVVGEQAGLALRLAGLGGHPHPLELALQACAGGPTQTSPRARDEPASAPASPSSSPRTDSPCRARARGSTSPRCRGSTGRG